jgi:AAA family ATP:ADP antiporter
MSNPVTLRPAGLSPEEGRLLALMGTLVAVLLCGYTIAKVLRDSLFLQEYGALSLPYAYIGVALASAGYIWVESRISRRLSSVASSRLNQLTAIGISIVAALALPHARHVTAAAFYVWTGSQAMMLIPYFWALALDVWDSRRARVLFPLLSGCGLIGGLAGGGIAASLTPIVHHVGLMWIVSGMLVIAWGLTVSVDRHRAAAPAAAPTASTRSSWEIIRESRYIKILTLGLGLAVVVGTLVDFQFKLLVQQMYPEKHQLTQFLGAFYAGLNGVSLLFQFGLAGWLLQRMGLKASTVLQPGAVIVFAACAAFTSGGWVVVALRWVQGVVSQTLGKSSAEIYYAAIHPKERRRVKPAIDTLTERWSDALVGVLLVIVLNLLHVPVKAITLATGVLAVVWLIVLFVLDRQYGRAFQDALSRRFLSSESAPEFSRLPSSRRALRAALASEDERVVLLALKLAESLGDAKTKLAVRACLRHPSSKVRSAAVEAMTAMRLPDPDRVIQGFLADSDEEVQRAAIGYLISRGEEPVDFARRVLDGGDPALREHLLEALVAYPGEARRLLGWDWIDARIASGKREDLLLAARATGAMDDPGVAQRLRTLLSTGDVEVQRLALVSATARPDAALLDAILPKLGDPRLRYEAPKAVAAVGDPAVSRLQALLSGGSDERTRAGAAGALSRIATPRALASLRTLVRSADVELRHLALEGLWRERARTGRLVLPRSTVHRLFLRELRDYRVCSEPVASLEQSDQPALRLLGDSYRESADRALERALEALACWYDPKPLPAVFERLKSRDLSTASPALEYLGHVLPRAVLKPVTRVFEKESMQSPDDAPAGDRTAEWIRRAWETGDGWLRAVAVRASRFVSGFDPRAFEGAGGEDPLVRAELEALAESRA